MDDENEHKRALTKILEEEFGIHSEAELDAAIAAQPKINLAPFCAPVNLGAGFPHFCFRAIMACRRSEAGSLLAPLSPLRSSIRCLAASAVPPLPNSDFAAVSIGTVSRSVGGAHAPVSFLVVFCTFLHLLSVSALETPPGLRGMTGNGFRAGFWYLSIPNAIKAVLGLLRAVLRLLEIIIDNVAPSAPVELLNQAVKLPMKFWGVLPIT